MNTCDKCGVYTRSRQSLCYTCLCEGNSYLTKQQRKPFEKDPLSYIKGNIAESLVLNLFVSCQFDVRKIGIEQRAGYRCGDALRNAGYTTIDMVNLSDTPDFIITNPETNVAELVEVKYRHDGRVPYNEVMKITSPNALLLLFSKDDPIYCLRISEIMQRGQSFKPDNTQTLKAYNPFNIDVGLIEIFETYSKMVFEGVIPYHEFQEASVQ